MKLITIENYPTFESLLEELPGYENLPEDVKSQLETAYQRASEASKNASNILKVGTSVYAYNYGIDYGKPYQEANKDYQAVLKELTEKVNSIKSLLGIPVSEEVTSTQRRK